MGPQISVSEYQGRLEALRSGVGRAGLDWLIVSSFDNISYLTGAGFEPLERPFLLVVPRSGGGTPTLIVPRLDADHMRSGGSVPEIRTYWDLPAPSGRGWTDTLFELIGSSGRVGIEPSLRADLAGELRDLSPEVVPLVEGLRRVKSAAEVAMIRRAAQYADRAAQELLNASYRGASVAEGFARTGVVTRSIITEVDDWDPLTTRVLMATWASPRSARPHSVPMLDDRLGDGSHVALAFLRVNGYAAESERTYFTTQPTPEMARAFRAMLEARAIAFRMIRPGVSCAEIDMAVGAFLEAEGYGGEHRRLHRTGHGIGLSNHEGPSLAEGSDEVLAENMVISIEPGIYLDGEGIGGYRHSDTVLVTRDGFESLTRLPTDLRSLTLRGWRPVARARGALVRRALRVGGGGEQRAEARDGTPRLDEDREPLRRKKSVAAATLLAAVVIGVPGLFAFGTITSPTQQMRVSPVMPRAPLDGFEDRLGRALQFRTIAAEGVGETDPAPFLALREFLEVEYPNVHRELKQEIFGEHSLLFRWEGKNPAIAPILLMSHLDVVPVEDGTESGWTYPPFSGRVSEGFIWGRGALDVKCGVLGALEAVELLLADGVRPTGDVYFAFGHDEEIGGRDGNRRIAEELRARGVRFRFVLDEGGGLTEGIIDGVGKAVAFVGVAERGYATIRISARAEGGHSSMPPRHTAVGMVSAAVARLEAKPFPARIDGATAAMLDYLGPEMPWPRRVATANRWLTEGLIARQFAEKPSLNALIRTTMAATVVRGGETANVLPERAEALVNVRLLPGDTAKGALRRIESEVGRLGFSPEALVCSLDETLSEPSRVSPVDSAGFRTLQRTIGEIYPNAIVSPGLSMVATDSRHYAPISEAIYRFLPLKVTEEDLGRIHGVDERIGVETYAEMIGFLARLIENLSAPEAAQTSSGTPTL